MYYEKAEKSGGKTGEVLLTTIERRLDNVIFRLGLASTRREARQLVNHGHFTVNGKRVNIPSYLIKVGDVIEVCEKSRSTNRFKTMAESDMLVTVPKWLEKSQNRSAERFLRCRRETILNSRLRNHLIVELYSK